MEFRTSLSTTQQSPSVQLGDCFITLGSCFANSMNQKLKESKFHSVNNPLGILYDPDSIARILTYAIDGTRPKAESFYAINNLVVNLETHSDMSKTSIDGVAEIINQQLNLLASELKKANWLILTLGTSWVYRHTSRNLQVANCHKIPQKEFEKSLRAHYETEPIYDALIEKLNRFNPNLQIITTVSPVRHVNDTLPLNNLSKSHLIILCHYLADKYQQVAYYPSYELIMDDLRDYRFYKTDMLHPNNQALGYVWEHFTKSFFTKEARDFLKEWDSIRKALEHKPFNPSSPNHQQFIKMTIERLKKIKPLVKVEKELTFLQSQLL